MNSFKSKKLVKHELDLINREWISKINICTFIVLTIQKIGLFLNKQDLI